MIDVHETTPVGRQLSRKFDWRSVAIAVVVATTGSVAVVGLSRSTPAASHYVVLVGTEAQPAATIDPLTTELVRCRTLWPQIDDANCRTAWESSRRHFFGETRAARAPSLSLREGAPVPLARTNTAPTKPPDSTDGQARDAR